MLQGSRRDKAKLIYILKAEGKASCDPKMLCQECFFTVPYQAERKAYAATTSAQVTWNAAPGSAPAKQI